MQAGPAILILDTSVLVNFLAINRAELLARLSTPILITDHVVAEISEHYPAQRECLDAALKGGHITQIQITDLAELEDFAMLTSSKPSKRRTLGNGECSAIAVALHRGLQLGVDDKAAIKFVKATYPQIVIRQTHEIMVDLIRSNAVTVEEADRIKNDWATNHSFALTHFASFSELLKDQK